MSTYSIDMSRQEREIIAKFQKMISHENAKRYGLFELPTFNALNKTYSYFIADTKDIATLGLEELDGHYFYTTSYPKIDPTLPQKVVLVARKSNDDGIYLTLLGDNKKILISMEDFYDGEYPIDRKKGYYTPGMVLVSNKRKEISQRKGSSLLFDEGISYQVRRTLEKVKEHPLTIDINNLTQTDYYESFNISQLRAICKTYLDNFREITQSFSNLQQRGEETLNHQQSELINRGVIPQQSKGYQKEKK